MKNTNITRPTLFYSKYDTKISIQAAGIGWVRWYRTAADLWKRIQIDQRDHFFVKLSLNPLNKLKEQDVVELFELKQLLENHRTGNCIAYTNHHQVSFYTNSHNPETIQALVDYANIKGLIIESHVVESQHPDIVYLKNPKHKHRVYLRAKTYDGATIDKLKSEFTDYLNTYSGTFYPCAALTKWLEVDPNKYLWYSRTIQNSHFIEYDEESALTMILMCFPQLIGKRYKIEQKP
jgi:hypothetical protein